MQEFKAIETSVLRIMLAAHTAPGGRVLTATETRDCNVVIDLLQRELALRKEVFLKQLH
jgi:hypothetical protein